MKSGFTLGTCTLARTYLIWEVCSLNAQCIHTHLNENTIFQYVDKMSPSSISPVPAIAHLQYAEPFPGARAQVPPLGTAEPAGDLLICYSHNPEDKTRWGLWKAVCQA